MADKAKVASIGLGWWGNVLADAAEASGEIEIVSCFARTPERREEFAAKRGSRAASSLEELLADPEVQGILIATAHTSHRELIEAAASAGKHIFVEKPLTLSVEDGRAAVDAAKAAGVVLQVGHQRRRTAGARGVRRLVEEGKLGELHLLESHHSVPNGFKLPKEAWRWNPEESPLGSMTSLGIHKIDDLMYLAGRIGRVYTFTRPGRDFPIDEATMIGFEFESGALGTLVSSFFTPLLVRLSVHGTGGAAFMDADGARLSYQATGETGREEIELSTVDPVVDQMGEFGRAVRGETTPEVDGEQGLEVVTVLQAAVASAESGKAVDVADLRR